MAINRAPFNALVDDAGTGTSGTPWNKSAIQTVLLDPIDAAIGGTWINIAYSAANFTTSGGGTWTGAAPGTNSYAVSNKSLWWTFYAINWAITGAPVSLNLAIPGGYLPVRNTGGPFSVAHGGLAGTGWWVTENTQLKLYRDILGTAWTAGANHVAGVFLITVV